MQRNNGVCGRKCKHEGEGKLWSSKDRGNLGGRGRGDGNGIVTVNGVQCCDLVVESFVAALHASEALREEGKKERAVVGTLERDKPNIVGANRQESITDRDVSSIKRESSKIHHDPLSNGSYLCLLCTVDIGLLSEMAE